MKHFNFSILHRTAIQLSRARMLLLLFVTMIAAISWAQTEGPWTYLSHRSAFTNFDQYNSTAYNYLGGSVWGNCYVQQYNNANDRTGLGIEIRGNSSAGQKNCVFSIYTHTENILSYSRKVMHWNYKFKSSSNAHVQTTALYARDDIDAIKNMEVDFTQDYTNQSNSKYRIALLKGVCYEYKSEEFTHDFEFDNRNSGTAADKKWALLMTYVIGNGGGSMNIDQYAGFRNISCSWTTYYYKHITFDKNGGSGSMSKTTIENSGELPACTLTRDGYCFAGWNTQADGSGIPYADQASVTATESDKGEVKLYAQWVSIASNLQAEFLQKDRKVKLTWTTQKGQAGAGKFVIYRNGVKIGTIDHTFLNNETSDFVYEDANTASESDFPNESEIIYDVCFVLNGWAEDIKLPELKASKTVNTTRKVPVNSIKAISQADRIIFTWTSDAYPLNWGNRFNIYVDDETTPIYTITPTDNQTSFQWEHRRDISHADRQNGVDGTIPYTSQSGLDVCSPHNYRIEGVIGETVLNAVTVNNRSIGGGTLFKSFTATKGVYPGHVKLSWNVTLGKEGAKTYIVERKRAEKDEPWTEIYRTSSADEFLTYTDDTPLPGIYYEYQVTVQDKCENGSVFSNEISDIGFAQSTGTMSGRITFGATGMAVANVDVVAKKTGDNNDDYEQYHAIRFKETNGAVSWDYPNLEYAKKTLSSKNFTIQLWINPAQLSDAKVARLNGETCYVGMTSEGKLYLGNGTSTYTFDDVTLTAGQYNHVTITRNQNTLTCCVVGADAAGVPILNKSTQNMTGSLELTDATQLSLGYFIGYVDEFRLWTKALSDKEILENYDHLLVGNEKNLETYWTFDEGLNTQFFDYSRDGTVYHQHHGKTGSNVEPSALTAEKLKLKAKTDNDGNYIIKGIPFTGEGTTYAVIPALGIHQFNPTQQMRYVCNNSLVHNGTDFTDISSFPVRGTIRYAHTDYPVEGLNFYVDGQICAKEGAPITTNAYGEYEISVPIGEHYITVGKQGHVFANDGRYPADPGKTGLLANYNDAVSNLDFEDVTLVTVAGRVTGGAIEEEKPLGFGVSENNIGQATITLAIDGYRLNVKREPNGSTVSYENNSEDLLVTSPTSDVNSESYRKGGDADDVKRIIIRTDSKTGEFAALLPPVDYRVESIKIESNPDVTFSGLPVLYASDPLDTETDSLILEDGTKKEFEYVAKLIESYYTEPVLEIVQQDHTDGSFGERNYVYNDPKTKDDTELTLYTVSENSPVTYNYAYPIFQQMKQYVFDVRGFERYVNKDGESDVEYLVPLRNAEVTFANQMGTGQGVVINPDKTDNPDDELGDLDEVIPDQVTLNEDGLGIYQWQAGLPNITSPYTLNLAATFTHNDKSYTWTGVNTANALTGIVIGALPTGSNFVTKGPDMIDMIIRDPGGSGSSAFWEKGQSVTKTQTQTVTVTNETEVMTHTEFGVELTSLMAAGVGVIMGVINTNSEKVTLDVGVKSNYEHVSSSTKTVTTTATKRFSTSGEPEYVGAQGDVFIGESTNIIFGNARSVGFQKDGQSGEIKLDMFNNYVTGQEFATHFQYTQNYIENTLIPGFINLRNDILRKGVDNEGLIYHTDLSADDGNYGAKGTYTTEKPSEDKVYADMVNYYNQQIANWERQLAYNEEIKVKAINNRRRYLDTNQSFDSGTFIDSEVTQENTTGKTTSDGFDVGLLVGSGTSVSIFGQDVDISFQTTTTAGEQWEKSNEVTNTTTTGYSLVETGDDDALSIDVYKAPDGRGAIFVTRGGQTTCPYEGEQKTKYFEPGKHVLATATQQIEVPRIAIENGANRLVGVPAGQMANYTLLLTNESETGENCYFDLFCIDETNSKGAGIDINSNELGSGRSVFVPAGGTVRMSLQLEQNPKGELIYENIAIVLSSQCQRDPASTWDVIGDTVYISAEFVPSSTEVTLSMENTVVNTSTKGMLPLTVKDYDPNYDGLKYIAVQYQGVGETAWHDARKYMVNADDISNNNIDDVLPAGGVINLNFDMTNSAVFPDRTYKFRALSAREYGNDVVTRSSQEIFVVKDMSRPKPLGQPQPTDGILQAGDELSILFNEAILSGELTKDQNFRVTGVLNGSTVDHQTALELENTTQTAATEASINLANKDFSFDMWVKANGAGTLLSHGTGTHKLTVGVNEDNKLVVGIGEQTYTSLNDVPQNQWSFLTLSLTQDGKLSASIATDAATTTLFNDKDVTAYEGNGPLSVGEQMTGAMHELLLWEEARDINTALQQRSVTKSPATRGLIGYWKMNEGEGMTLTDYARNRHMSMAAETWHIENENKAVSLDGEHFVSINTTAIPPMPQDDYAVELWVKAGEQSADAQLLQLGEAGLSLNAEGNLQLESKNSSLITLHSSLTDNAWHHVALSVLRNGNANVYVDGVAKGTVSADKIGSLGSDQLIIGARRTLQDVQQSEVLYQYDRPLTGLVDEVRIWNATMNADQLKKQRKVRLTGDEPGLVAYYPFELKTLDSQNQVVTNGDAADLCGSGYEAQLSTLDDEPSTLSYTDTAPALRVKPEEENVSFTFTASDNKIVIELNEEAAKVEGCTLNFTVRDVHDKNGNLSEPVSWSAFVSQNPLKWQEAELALTQQVTEESTLTATLVNKSGKEQIWSMGALPSWLEADAEYGSLQPLAVQTITFTVSEATPIGKYEQTVYVSGNDGIETPLTLNIKVTGNVPDWAVNPHDYENSMNVICVVKKDDVPLADPDDLLAAFIGDECRGLAHLEYNAIYGNYYATMDIYGNSSDGGKEVSFRAYDSTTGTIYPEVKWTEPTPCQFIPPTLMGSYAEPKVFNILDKIEQVTELKTGWNWISFNVVADDMTIPELFKTIADDVETVKSQGGGYLSYANDVWGGNLTGELSNTAMYAIKMKADRKLRVVGQSVHTPVEVFTGWNWIGYYGLQVASLGDALADMAKGNGDIVKAQRGVTYWDDNNSQWLGSLLMMEPGKGYQIKCNTANQTFAYPASVMSNSRKLAPGRQETQSTMVFSPVDFHTYPDNAIMAVKVVANGQSLNNIELGVFDGEECRSAAMTNGQGIAYLTIPGDETCLLTFKVAFDGEVVETPVSFTYETDAIYGTPQCPMIISFDDADGIWKVLGDTGNDAVYDLSGRKVVISRLPKGVYIINGEKKAVK